MTDLDQSDVFAKLEADRREGILDLRLTMAQARAACVACVRARDTETSELGRMRLTIAIVELARAWKS